jgi:hypothetical protein
MVNTGQNPPKVGFIEPNEKTLNRKLENVWRCKSFSSGSIQMKMILIANNYKLYQMKSDEKVSSKCNVATASVLKCTDYGIPSPITDRFWPNSNPNMRNM